MTKTKLFGVIAVTAALSALLGVTMIGESESQQPNLSAAKGVIQISGIGTGTLSCSDGSTSPSLEIEMAFNPNAEGGAGSISLTLASGGFTSRIAGPSLIGDITQNSFNIKGIISSVNICGDISPVVVTVSGDCGVGTTINYAAADGTAGSFAGNVACLP